MIQSFYTFDFERMADLVEQNFQTRSNLATGSVQPGTCLAIWNTSTGASAEKTAPLEPQVATVFDLLENPAHLVAGLRYETTDIASSALVPVPADGTWVGDNELNVVFEGGSSRGSRGLTTIGFPWLISTFRRWTTSMRACAGIRSRGPRLMPASAGRRGGPGTRGARSIRCSASVAAPDRMEIPA